MRTSLLMPFPLVLALSGCESGGDGERLELGNGVTVTCQQKDDADGDDECVGRGDKTRKLDCDESQVAAALEAGCEPTEPGETDVCCPPSVRGIREAESTTIACQQKDDADGDSECVGRGDKTRKLDCGEGQVAEALAAGCERVAPDATDVCCLPSVNGTLDI